MPIRAVEGLDSGIGGFLGFHCDKAKATRAFGDFVEDKIDLANCSMLRERVLEIVFCDVKG